MARASAAAAARPRAAATAPAKPRATRAATAAPAKPRTAPKRAPAQPRRRSGPAAPPKGAPRKPATQARPAAQRKPATSEWLASAIAARGNLLLDRLLRGRLWVGCIGVLLAGIVFLNVGLLQLNDQIARTDKRSGTIGRENATLRLRLAKLDSTERIQRLAAQKGFVMPAPGAVRYVRSKPGDGRAAARAVVAPEPRTAVVAPAPAPQAIVPAPAAGATPAAGTTPATGTTPAGTQPVTTPQATAPAPAAGVPAAAAPAATQQVP
jgi:hypothetical protein